MQLSDFQRICFSYLPDQRQRLIRAQFNATDSISIKDLDETCRSLDVRLTLDQQYCQNNNISLVSFLDDTYPELLHQIPDFPLMLYVKGRVDCLAETACVGIVGTRHATPYGLDSAKNLARDLARSGVTIISGLAQGIDAAAHSGALETGTTIAVMGTGIDVCFPASHRQLMEQVINNGCVVSEFPLKTHGSKITFPSRNRIIAGLSRGVLVVESPSHGGSLITARLALEYNRDVFALPGRINDLTSEGTNQLIRDGATLVRNAGDILSELRWTLASNPGISKDNSPADLSETEYLVLRQLSSQAMSLDDLNYRVNLESGNLLSCLSQLELKELVVAEPGGFYRRTTGMPSRP